MTRYSMVNRWSGQFENVASEDLFGFRCGRATGKNLEIHQAN
jgi:hypothetical protein